MMTYYHGTDSNAATNMEQQGINLSLGGGELGKGFYIGSSLWRACSWAWQVAHKKKMQYAVIKFDLDEDKFLSLRLHCLNRQTTIDNYGERKRCNNTQDYEYSNVDAVWAPIVGRNVHDAYQIKFQNTECAKVFINQTTKQKIK